MSLTFKKTLYNTRFKCVCCSAAILPLDLKYPNSIGDLFFRFHKILEHDSGLIANRYVSEKLPERFPQPGDPTMEMIDNGMIGKFAAGYGSCHDGDVFLIAICDDCIKEKTKTGNVVYDHNYMGYDMDDSVDHDEDK